MSVLITDMGSASGINLELFVYDCVQNTDFVNWPVCEINQLQEGNQTELVYAAIDFSRGRESNT